MTENNPQIEKKPEERTLKNLIDTPFKKLMFVLQIISYVLIVASPLIGAAIGALFNLSTAKIGMAILVIFIAGEILFYGSLIFLGKEIVLLIKEKLKKLFKKKKKI